MTKSELCQSSFPKPWVGLSKSLGGPLTLGGIFQKPGWSYLHPPPSHKTKADYFIKHAFKKNSDLYRVTVDLCTENCVYILWIKPEFDFKICTLSTHKTKLVCQTSPESGKRLWMRTLIPNFFFHNLMLPMKAWKCWFNKKDNFELHLRMTNKTKLLKFCLR